jgi:hypothetical protein
MSDHQNTYASEAELFDEKAKRRYDVVQLPTNGKRIRIQSLMEQELAVYQGILASTPTGTASFRNRLADAARRLIVLCAVDGAGNRILNKSHVARMGTEWDAADVQTLFDRCVQHVGIRTGDIEELVKNSEETSDGSLPTVEPVTPAG